MKKFFTNLLATTCAIFFFSVASNAQAVIWEEQFDGGFNGWTEDTVSNTTTSDTLSWKWTDTGSVGPVMLQPIPAPNSTAPTAMNGAAYVNFEYWAFGADLANVPANPPYGNLISHLISPPIDLTDVSGPMNLRFNQLAKLLNTAAGYPQSTNVSFSADGGVTWSADIGLNGDLEIRNVDNGVVTIPVPSNLGLQGSSQAHVRFTYANDFYYWMIDDIQLIERTERNMQANTNFFAIAPNYSTPKDQVEAFPFLVDIENIGGQTETGVNVNIEIRNVSSGSIAYSEDKAYGTIGPDSLAENAVFGSFTPAAEAGLYRGTYTVSADSVDSDMSNNTINFDFEITDDQFRKEAGNNLSGIAASADNSWSMGNVFYIPNDGFEIGTVTFGISNPDAVVGQFMTIKVLSSDGDMDASGIFEAGEYDLVAFNGYTFDGTEGPIIEIPADLDGNPIPLTAGKYYIILMEYTDLIDQTVFFSTTTDHDYGAMVFASDSLGATRYGTLLDVGNSTDLTTGNFTGGYFVPAIRINRFTVGTNELSDENLVNVFPNPTADQLNLDLDLVEQSEVLDVTISDITGRVFLNQTYENVKKDRLSFNLKNYPAGSYFVHLTTEKGVKAIPFMVAH